MKKLEYILYALTLIIAVIVLMAKSMLWFWAGPFLIISYSTLAMIFILLSPLIYTLKSEGQKRYFFIYGTIPMGLPIATLLLTTLAKLQHWSWHQGAFRMTIFLFVIVEIIFITAYLLLTDVIRRDFVKKMMLKTFLFIAITFAIGCIDFDQLISALSTKEANEQREIWRRESEQAESFYQNSGNN